ncbi:MAG TPA: hypothetical protein VEF04_20515 [Blastocatellia bacterium]|nr:hypothetical protein [Blastocatellia bacterium]
MRDRRLLNRVTSPFKNISAMRISVIACSLMLLAIAALALGQSGRKQKKADPLPPVQGVPESKTKEAPVPEPAVPEETEKKPAQVKHRILIGSDSSSFDISMYSMNVARQACVDELRREAGRDVTVQDGGSMHRSDAVKAAKDTDQTYAVYLEVRAFASSNQAELSYTLFAPKTGKVSTTGRGFPVQYNNRMPRPPIAMSRMDYEWELCGRDVARQLINRLHLGSPLQP